MVALKKKQIQFLKAFIFERNNVQFIKGLTFVFLSTGEMNICYMGGRGNVVYALDTITIAAQDEEIFVEYEEIMNKFIIILTYLHNYLTEWVSLSVCRWLAQQP